MLTIIGVHACHIKANLHEFFDTILFFDLHGLLIFNIYLYTNRKCLSILIVFQSYYF